MGWAREEIAIEPQGYAMSGYGMHFHRAATVRSPLYARALVVDGGTGPGIVLCCLDMAMVTHAMRSTAVDRLQSELGDRWSEEGFVLTCTHTHSSPGGCGHEAMYNFVTPGFQPAHLEAVGDAVASAVERAWNGAARASLTTSRSTFDPTDEVAWNRALDAHLRNPEATPCSSYDAHIAVDREMTVVSVHRDGKVQALLSLFGVHATSLGNTLDAHDGDNKGRASLLAEEELRRRGATDPVAVFAQATAGDVSPHYHGPGQRRRRRAVRRQGDDRHAQQNGALQCERALAALDEPTDRLGGTTDAVLAYVDLVGMEVPAEFAGGTDGARTSDPCHGAAFFDGTPVDGPGAPRPVGLLARALARWLRRRRLARNADTYYSELYAAQDPKDIVLEAQEKLALGRSLARTLLPDIVDPLVAEMKREARSGALDDSPLVPTVLPVQLVRLGSALLVCMPGEFTTVAGRRLVDAVRVALGGVGIDQVLLVTYCNDYMGYVTTPEEYEAQTYEGGHTIFGRWTLGAFQDAVTGLARQLQLPPSERTHDRDLRPSPVPEHELALRSDLPPRGRQRHSR